MSLDLNTLLEGWPHEPGQLAVRKIRGDDGREKIQLRLDLGLIQMETIGRPDGTRPHGADSLLAWHREQAEAAGEYTLTGEDCNELHQEGAQYYHRYLALFQLGDFEGVVRDTQYNLDLLALVARHAEQPDMTLSFEAFRPYILMMHTRALASLELEKGNPAAALKAIEKGRERILEIGPGPEAEFLAEWQQELRAKQPLSKLEKLQREMDQAIQTEAYERAAELRDAIRRAQKRRE